MAYSGNYQPINISKYDGDHSKIRWRSLWEQKVMKWCDLNPDVIEWNSEEVVIPYICKTDGRKHRYFMDFKIEFSSGNIILVEVKPKNQTKRPIPPRGNRKPNKRFLNEVMTYAKNDSKWKQAEIYATARGWIFQIWTEEILEKMGIKVLKQVRRRR